MRAPYQGVADFDSDAITEIRIKVRLGDKIRNARGRLFRSSSGGAEMDDHELIAWLRSPMCAIHDEEVADDLVAALERIPELERQVAEENEAHLATLETLRQAGLKLAPSGWRRRWRSFGPGCASQDRMQARQEAAST